MRNKRDPYADWWDKQDRRNYGEPVHEDNDIQGALSLHDYNHFTPGWAGVLFGTFIVSVFGLCAVVSQIYPDKISVPKQYEDGLEAELGGPRAVRVSSGSWGKWWDWSDSVLTIVGKEVWRGISVDCALDALTCVHNSEMDFICARNLGLRRCKVYARPQYVIDKCTVV